MSEFAKAWANEQMPDGFEYVAAFGLAYVNKAAGIEIHIDGGWWKVEVNGRALKTAQGRVRAFRSPLAAYKALAA
jgi:hypothetical protein